PIDRASALVLDGLRSARTAENRSATAAADDAGVPARLLWPAHVSGRSRFVLPDTDRAAGALDVAAAPEFHAIHLARCLADRGGRGALRLPDSLLSLFRSPDCPAVHTRRMLWSPLASVDDRGAVRRFLRQEPGA